MFCPLECGISWSVFCVHLKTVCILVECSINYVKLVHSVIQVLYILADSSVLSITEKGMLKCPSTSMDLSTYTFNSFQFCFIYIRFRCIHICSCCSVAHVWHEYYTVITTQYLLHSSRVWLCNPVDCSIQPSHPLLSSSPPALNLSQHQGLFQQVGSL